MASQRSTSTQSSHSSAGGRSSFADWFSAIAIAIGGGLSLLSGVLLTSVLDRGQLVDAGGGEELTVLHRTTVLTNAETATLVTDVVTWTGIGFLVIGAVAVPFAIWFAIARYRARRKGGGPHRQSLFTSAVHGGVVGVIAGFVPIFPAIGGAVGGYVRAGSSGRGASVGALAGLLAAFPVIILLTAVLIGLTDGLLTIERGDMATLAGGTLVVVVVLATVLAAGLGALGGIVGRRVGE